MLLGITYYCWADVSAVEDEAINEDMDDSLERAATTATSLDVEQDRGNIFKTQSKATPNEPGYPGTSSGSGPSCQETIGDTVAQTRSVRVSKISNDLLLRGVNIPRSGEDSLKLNELMELCTKLQQRVLDLETTKITRAVEIRNLKRRVKKLERRKRSRTYRLERLYKFGFLARVKSSKDEALGEENASKQGRITEIDANKDITLVSTHDEQMFDVDQDLSGKEVFVAQQDENVVEKEVDAAQLQVTTAATTLIISIDEATLDQALAELNHAKPKAKAKGIVFHKLEESTTATTTAIAKPRSHDKELHAKFEKEQRLASERAQQEVEANIALIESWDDVQAKIDAEYQLAERLQAKEQQELNDE
nr:hypothetical protein [Tanacetum cinerariifolium]